jgi:hypothetical protein
LSASSARAQKATSAPVASGPRTQLTDLVCLRMIWRGGVVGPTMQPFREARVESEAAWPVGRKGLVIHSMWKQLSKPTSDGMLIMDGDVVIDPVDLTSMLTHVATDINAVWVAPIRLWPRSTHLPGWVWGHRKPTPEGATTDEVMTAWQEDIDDPTWFTFCFTFLPRALVEQCCKDGMRNWIYPHVDQHVHETSTKMGLRVKVVRAGCHPRHVNN